MQLPLFHPPIKIHTVIVNGEAQHRISSVLGWWQGTRWDCECMAMIFCGDETKKREIALLEGIES